MTNLLILFYSTISLGILLYSFIYKDIIDDIDDFDFILLSGAVCGIYTL